MGETLGGGWFSSGKGKEPHWGAAVPKGRRWRVFSFTGTRKILWE